MVNLLAQAIDCDERDRAAAIIQTALGIESSDILPKTWPKSRKQRAAIIGDWLSDEARFWACD
jgi:hypothetical protein